MLEAAAIAGGAFAAASGVISLGIFHPRVALFGPIVWHGRRDQQRVALSFDDGPHPEFTPQVAEAIRAVNGHATFFVVGKNVEAHEDVARALLANGHELANHTFTHGVGKHLFLQSHLQADLLKCKQSLEKLNAPSKLYRPAVGIRNPVVHAAAKALGLTVVTWADAPRDGAWPFTEEKARAIAARAQGGDILALHDGVLGGPEHVERRKATVRHLPVLLAALRDRGFEVSTVSAVL